MPPLGKKGSVFPARSQGVFGCENCREHHQKCDRATPECGRCKTAGRKCRRTGLRLRETEEKYAFPKTQKWVKTPRRILFINETNPLGNDAAGPNPDSGPEDYLELDQSGSPETLTHDTSRRPSLQSPVYSSPAASLSPSGIEKLYSATGSFISKDYHAQKEAYLPTNLPHLDSKYLPKAPDHAEKSWNRPAKRLSPSDRFIVQPVQGVHLDHPIWPLNNPLEAQLFRHFEQKLSIWLDLCDPKQSFQTIVPDRAGRCPILLNAILALSGRHLAHVHKGIWPRIWPNYAKECLHLLNTYSGGQTELLEEDVFAATVIMRVLAEMESKDNGRLNEHYLHGLQVFVQDQKTSLNPNSLGAAAFWVALRQEIYFAVTRQTHVEMLTMDTAPWIVDRELTGADDYTWANRAVVHCADVLNYYFGSDKSWDRWNELMVWNRKWSSFTPHSFTAIYMERGDRLFPEIWLRKTCHVIGTQHHLLARLFLTRFKPDTYVPGGLGQQGRGIVEPSLRETVREICGIGLGNEWSPPSMFTACMAIHAFGDLFYDDSRAQEAMMGILQRAEVEHGRPTDTVQAQMKKIWGWSPECTPEHPLKCDMGGLVQDCKCECSGCLNAVRKLGSWSAHTQIVGTEQGQAG